MPFAASIHKLAPVLTDDAISAMKENNPEVLESLRTPGSLIQVADDAVGFAAHERAWLEAIPPVLREGIRAMIVQAMDDGKAVHLQYSPGYDFEIRAWDFGEAVGVHISGPYGPTFARDEFPGAPID
jgi:hypothetical protein